MSLNPVQQHYERLRHEHPDWSHRELWRPAEKVTVTKPVFVEEAAAVKRVFGVSRRAVIGFALMCVATSLSTGLFLWMWDSPSGWAYSPVGGWLWVTMAVLGTVSLGLVSSAHRQLNRYLGAVPGRSLVVAGLVLAAIGIVEMMMITAPVAMVGSL